MLEQLAPDLWHATYGFSANGIACTSRMTVVRLRHGGLWLHSPIPISPELQAQLNGLGEVQYIVAPSKLHHLFAGPCAALFPQARLMGAHGLRNKRPDLTRLEDLPAAHSVDWWPDLDYVLFDGLPMANETEWFHAPSATLILTDLCQWWQGDLPWSAKTYASLTGTRTQLSVSRIVRLAVRNRAAARASAERILQWPFQRVIVAHNVVLETEAFAAVARAFSVLGIVPPAPPAESLARRVLNPVSTIIEKQ